MSSLSSALQHRLGYLTARQSQISSNLANVNTPNYQAKDISFQSMVDQQTVMQSTTNEKHMVGGGQASSYGKVTSSKLNPKHNGNTVHIDEQMLKMNETQLQYRLATSLYSKHASMQKMALGAGAAQ